MKKYYFLRVEFVCALGIINPFISTKHTQFSFIPPFFCAEMDVEVKRRLFHPSRVFAHNFLSLHRRKMPLSIYASSSSSPSTLARNVCHKFYRKQPEKVLSQVSRSIIHYLHVITFTFLLLSCEMVFRVIRLVMEKESVVSRLPLRD